MMLGSWAVSAHFQPWKKLVLKCKLVLYLSWRTFLVNLSKMANISHNALDVATAFTDILDGSHSPLVHAHWFYLLSWRVGAHPSMHLVRCGVHRWRGRQSIAGANAYRQTNTIALTFTPTGNLELLSPDLHVFGLETGEKPEQLQKTRSDTLRT